MTEFWVSSGHHLTQRTAGGGLVLGQVGLVVVHVDVVGVDPHLEHGRRGGAAEARLQPDGEQRDREVRLHALEDRVPQHPGPGAQLVEEVRHPADDASLHARLLRGCRGR